MDKVLSYTILSGDTARQITASREEWTNFLRLSGRLYKYPFAEQLLIYAQRPEAEACAEYDFWNKRMQRYVRRGSKGIALIDQNSGQPRLKYVFDVADTGGKRKPYLWKYDEQRHSETVGAALEQEYGVSESLGLAGQLKEIAEGMAAEYWEQNRQDILGEVIGSALSRLPEEDIAAEYVDAARVSIAYTLLSRCGLAPELYFENEEFLSIFDFTTPATVAVLGAAVSDCSEQLLRQIEIVVKTYEREHKQERIEQNERSAGNERADIPAEGRLSIAGVEYGRVGNANAGQIRPAAAEVSAGAEASPVDKPFRERSAEQTPAGSGGGGQPQAGTVDERNVSESRADRGVESAKSPEVGGVDEQPAPAGGGNSLGGDSSDLTESSEQLSFFDIAIPSEQQQRAAIEKAAPFAFIPTPAFSQEVIDNVLRFGGNAKNNRMQIAAEFSKQKPLSDKAAYLSRLFNGGNGFLRDEGNVAAWYADEGIRLGRGDSARYGKNVQVVSWEQAAERIDELLNAGEFASELEVAEALGYERRQIAERLWYIARDLSDEGKEKGLFAYLQAEVNKVKGGGFPAEAEKCAQLLSEPESRDRIIREYAEFLAAYKADHAVMRFNYWYVDEVQSLLQDLPLPRLEYKSQIVEVNEISQFITEDEINAALGEGGNVSGGKQRIYNFFQESHTAKEKADFLKNEYGTGGSIPVRSGWLEFGENHDSRGITFNKKHCPDVRLNWNMTAKRIDKIIEQGRYVTPEELAEWAEQAETRLQKTQSITVVETGKEIYTLPVVSAETESIIEPTPNSNVEIDEPEVLAEETAEVEVLPNEPKYTVGDTVYLDNKPFRIEEIDQYHIHLLDPSLIYPIGRVENKENFAWLLRQDKRNDFLFNREETTAIFDIKPEDIIDETPKNEFISEVEIVEPEVEIVEAVPVENYHITDDDLGAGGQKAKYAMNVAAIRTLKQIETENRQTTPEEQEILAKYVGWGALPEVFDSSKENWQAEYAELKELLIGEEYTAARESVLNAHYTSPTVIKAIYEGLSKLGFAGGKILEPSCGVGNFLGLLPEEMRNSQLYGVELDSLTGRIAKQLYPKANIQIKGFEETNFQDNSFDIAVGNVPFGNYSVFDPAYNRYNFSIHNYFFAKALAKIHPGGVLAFVTSRYTMDAKDSKVREYLAERADLLGAIRLPNNTFKNNAGTEVVSDIIFLQKREKLRDLSEDRPDWVNVGENADGFKINQYFLDRPEQVLGKASAVSTQYAAQDYTVIPIPGADLAEQLQGAISNIQGKYLPVMPDLDIEPLSEEVIDVSGVEIANYSFGVINGDIYYRIDNQNEKQNLGAAAKRRVKGLIDLRDCTRKLIALQMNEDTGDYEIKKQQYELNRLYDSFTAEFGLINDRANRLAFSQDSSYYLLCALEILDDKGRLKQKADMFSKRTIMPHKAPEKADTAIEAYAISISEKARIDLPYMMKLTGKTEEELTAELQGIIFFDPVWKQWQPADEYLSGNVRWKLKIAEAMAADNPALAINVEALQKVQPRDLEAQEIEVRLGTTWIPPAYFKQFMWEVLQTPRHLRHTVELVYSSYANEWRIERKSAIPFDDVAAYNTYGTERANAYKILEDSLNMRDVRIYDTVQMPEGGEKRVLNAKETTLAQQKQQALKDAFKDWIWHDPERRETLVNKYNEEMNCIRPREYDGSHINFVGMNPEITLREHQINAIARVLYGGNTLLAHEVGAGKTFEMAAAAMESKRLGLCHKSLFVVPNHLVEQWASEILRLYPAANVLVTNKRDFAKENRKKFCSRIATGNYDAIIIGQSQFEKIPISPERQERLLLAQIKELTAGIAELKENRGEHFSIKQMELGKKNLMEKLNKLYAQGNKRKDDVICFEELGVDRMFVDESDFYKNLFIYTKMRNVAGLSTTNAQKSSDMFAKCRYLDEITGGKGVIFATGTPISNSITEMYTIQRYLQYDKLQEMGMGHFDSWASRFGETATALELAPEGTGYRARTRFAKFFNVPELMNLFKETADIKTADQLNLPTPEVDYLTFAAKPTEHQKVMVKELSERAETIHKKMVDSRIDNMLKITSDGRKLGLDQRIINPDLPDEPGTKVNLCVENVLKYWREGEKDRLTQLVFCDISTPQKTFDGEPGFTDIYSDIKKKLIAGGMRPEQVAFIHEADTDVKKKELFVKVRSGQVRVLIGSTAKMGAGTNVQDRLIASHDLDCPWRPRDLIQREGRIRRQGNMNKKVHVCRYVTEATFDSYLWQTVETKQRFISQIMTSKSPVRTCEDVDEAALSYAEIKALCAGDPRIKERMELDVEVSKLKTMKANHQSQQFRLQDNLTKHFPRQIKETQEELAALQADKATALAHQHPSAGFIGMEIDGVTYHEKDKAGAALLQKCEKYTGTAPKKIGSYRGFGLYLSRHGFGQTLEMTLKGLLDHCTDLGKDVHGNIIRLDNALAHIDKKIQRREDKLINLQSQVQAAELEQNKPFEFEAELAQKNARLIELDMELNMDNMTAGPAPAANEPVQAEEKAIKPELAERARASVLERLRQPLPPRPEVAAAAIKPKHYGIEL